MSNMQHGVMKIPTAGFATAPALTGAVPSEETAGVDLQRIPSIQGVEQLDLLDDGHALVRCMAETGSGSGKWCVWKEMTRFRATVIIGRPDR